MFAPKKLRVTKVGERQADAATARVQNARRDIKCGFRECRSCYSDAKSAEDRNSSALPQHVVSGAAPQEPAPVLSISKPILVPDLSSALGDIAAFEHSCITNIVLLSTVINAVKEANRATHARWMTLVNDPTKACYVFANDFHYATQVQQQMQTTAATVASSFAVNPVEQEAQRNREYGAKCARVAVEWLSSHLQIVANSSGFSDSSSAIGPFLMTNSMELYCPDIAAAASSAATDASVTQEQNQQQQQQQVPTRHGNIRTLRDFISEVFKDDTQNLDQLSQMVGSSNGGGTQIGQDGGASGGFQPFTPHWPASDIEAGLRSGAIFSAKVRASDSSPFYGELRGQVVAAALGSMLPAGAIRDGGFAAPRCIAIPGKAAMNRCFHDDIVAVQMLPLAQWRSPVRAARGAGGNRQQQQQGPPTSDPVEALRAGWTPTARVVGIVSTEARRPLCGSIESGDASADGATNDGTLSVLFQPKSSKFPKIRLQTRHAADLRGKRLQVLVDEWPENMSNPRGHVLKVIGPVGDKDTEATVILMENDVPYYDFSPAVYDCLPKGEWKVEESEVKVRWDLRDRNVCSVDPLGCRDIDDALHYRELPTTSNGGQKRRCEIGVHIADVAHFVKEGTAIDEEAKKRCTSVYLVDRRINMLPQLLTENLCSIVGNEDRYAFSVVWEFNIDDIDDLSRPLVPVSERFAKTIICSRKALYYGHAQAMIDDDGDQSELTQSLRGLMRFSRRMKADRDREGALTLGGQEFKFKIDNDHVNPTDMESYKTFETNSMVEEWMLYANCAAARKCYSAFPDAALLRRHEPPGADAFEALNASLVKRRLPPLIGSSSKGLNETLNSAVDGRDPFFNKLVRILTTRCLRQAQYFSTGDVPSADSYRHFGLAMGQYTHFTSPIRRYADVVVHRQLACAIGVADRATAEASTTGEAVSRVAAVINYRHEMAQKAGRDSQNLFTGFYLRNFGDSGIPLQQGYIVKVSDSEVNVFVQRYGQEGRVPIETLPACYRTLGSVGGVGGGGGGGGVTLDVFSQVTVRLRLLREGDVLGVKLGFELVDPSEVAREKSDEEKRREAEARLTEEKLEAEECAVADERGGARRGRE